MSFNNIIGNQDAKDYLIKNIEFNNILHSYLFVGTEGIGKKMIATEFAKRILCLNKKDNCNCKSCIRFDGGNHPDFYVIDEEDNIKVETIRILTEKVYEKPIVSEKKVYIINDCEKMTPEAQNCLLKTLEEPPEFVVIILITSKENLLLNTIKSRCMTVKFKNIDEKDLLDYCTNELNMKNVSPNMLKMFDGSIGRALKLKDYGEKYSEIENYIMNIENSSIIDIMQNKAILEKDSINDILEYVVVCLYSKANENIKYLNCIEYVNDCMSRLRSYSNYDMTIDKLLFKMWEELNEKSNRR